MSFVLSYYDQQVMTSNSSPGPKNARPRAGREYVWPSQPPYELAVPSVTSILAAGLPKPALQYWAAKAVAEFAYDHVDGWRGLPREAAIDLLKRAPYRATSSRAGAGSAVHRAIDAHLKQIPDRDDLTDEERGLHEAAVAFLSDHEPEVLHGEVTVYSRQHLYAGTADILARIGGVPVVIDFKTGKAVYPEYAIQLASYAFADFATDGDLEIPLDDLGPFRSGLIVRLGSDGRYEAVRFRLDSDLFAVFLAAKEIHSYQRDAASYIEAGAAA